MMPGELLTTSAYVIGALVFYFAAREKKTATEGMGWIALAGLLGGVVGAKITEWILLHPQFLLSQPGAILNPHTGGRTLIGGVLCGWLAVEITKWKLGIRRSTGDLFALALPAGEAVGRIGCHFNECCYGVASALPLSVHQHEAWRFPSQLLSSLVAFAIFVLLWTQRNRVTREGDLFRLYLLLYGATRFGIEWTRERQLSFGGLSIAQWVCLELAVAGALGLWFSQRKTRVLVAQGSTH